MKSNMIVHNTNREFSRKKANVYKYVFYIFCLSGIFKSLETESRLSGIKFMICKFGVRIFNIFVYAFQLISSFSTYYYYYTEKPNHVSIGLIYFCINLLCVLGHVNIFQSLNDLHLFTQKILRIARKLSSNRDLPRWIPVWSCIIMCTNVYIFVQTPINLIYDDETKPLFFSLTTHDRVLRGCFFVVSSFFLFILLYMPFNTFSIYYVLICRDVENLIFAFHKIMKLFPKPNYSELAETYSKVKSIVELVDSRLGFIIFTSFAYDAFLIYFGLKAVLYDDATSYIRNNIPILLASIVGLLNFVALTIAADAVNRASLIVKAELRHFQENDPKLVCPYLRFQQTCKEEVSLSVWGLVAIKRNIIFAMLGSILTYSLLFESLSSGRNNSPQ